MKKFLVSGTTSGVGKTTVVAAILSLLEDPTPFKCGPDYIDPMFHNYVCGKKSRNLDLFMMKEEVLKYLFSKDQGVKVLEGMMGLYDGLNHELDNFSAAHISRVLKTPVLLVVDGRKVSTSIAATVKGFVDLDPRVEIKGVIINRVRESMYYHLKEAIEKHTDVTCYGYLPDDEEISISERHLGLMQAEEITDLNTRILKLNQVASKTIDIDGILRFAESEEINVDYSIDVKGIFEGLRVGIARDLAFSFYYEDNLALMRESGIKLVEFSPMKDKEIPEVDFLYFGGGYPEVFASKLESNESMKNSIRKFSYRGGRIYAECGGMMYLSKQIIQNNTYDMVGLFDHSVRMMDKLNINRFGYVNCVHENMNIPAHEFHYSEVIDTKKTEYYFDIEKETRSWKGGFIKGNVLAGYPHIHFYSNIEFFKRLFRIDLNI